MRTHVTNTVRACFAALRQISSVRRAVPQHTLLTLVLALVITKLDQCNSVLVGTSGYLQDRLQSVLNAAARLVYSRRMSEHTTSLLRELHWLRVRQPAADIRDRRPSSSSFCRQPDAAGTVNSSGNSRRPRASCGCNAGMKQPASTDQDRLLSDNIPARNQGLLFLSVIRLTEVYHCPFSR